MRLGTVFKGEKFDREPIARAYRAAFLAYGIDVEALPEADAALKLKAAAIQQPLAAALDDWSSLDEEKGGARLRDLANAIDPDPARQAVRAALARRDVAALKDLAARDDADALPPATLRRLGTTLRALGDAASAESLLRRGQRRYPADLWINHELAEAIDSAKSPNQEDVIRFYSAALALRPESAGIHFNLAYALRKKGRSDEAMFEYRRAIAIQPNFLLALVNLGIVLRDNAMPDEAITTCRRAVALQPDYADAHSVIAAALLDKRRLNEALVEFRQAVELAP